MRSLVGHHFSHSGLARQCQSGSPPSSTAAHTGQCPETVSLCTKAAETIGFPSLGACPPVLPSLLTMVLAAHSHVCASGTDSMTHHGVCSGISFCRGGNAVTLPLGSKMLPNFTTVRFPLWELMSFSPGKSGLCPMSHCGLGWQSRAEQGWFPLSLVESCETCR